MNKSLLRKKVIDLYNKYNKPNWDGYGSDPITLQYVNLANELITILPKEFDDPFIAPTSDGEYLFEWKKDGKWIAIDFNNNELDLEYMFPDKYGHIVCSLDNCKEALDILRKYHGL